MHIPLDKAFKLEVKLRGIHFGIVVDNSSDPDKRGGIRVKIPGIFEANEKDIKALPLIYPAHSIGGTQDNTDINIPRLYSNVFVEFLNDDPLSGQYISSLLSQKSFPEIFKESYPNSMGKTWAGPQSLPSWLRINRQEDYVELYLNPSKALLKIDKEGRIFVKTPNDISFISDQSINLIAKNNINCKSTSFNNIATSISEKATLKNQDITTWNVKSTTTNLDLGTLIKKTIAEAYQTGTYSITVPQFVVNGIINSANAMLGTINGTPVQGLFVGTPATYAGGPYTAVPAVPVVVPPLVDPNIEVSEEITSFIESLVDSFVTDYAATSEYMKKQSDELRATFQAFASKLTGAKDMTLKKEEVDLSDPLLQAEEYLVALKGKQELENIKAKLILSQLDATGSLASMNAKYATQVVDAHSQLQDGFDSQTNYKDVVSEMDPKVQKELLDTFNSSAPPELKMTPPGGASSFANTDSGVFDQWFGNMDSSQFLPVVNGPIFNLLDFTGMTTWAKTNIFTSMTNYKQKNIVPSWTTQAKQQFDDFVLLVRKIEMISCKIYELIKLIEDLIKAIANLQIDINKIIQALSEIEIILPTWIKDLINQLINQIKAGDLPQFCTVGTISLEELQSLPSDLQSLFGKQNKIVTKSYQYQKQYETLINTIKPSTDLLNSMTDWSKNAVPNPGIFINK